jgi:hypothetical protein
LAKMKVACKNPLLKAEEFLCQYLCHAHSMAGGFPEKACLHMVCHSGI